MNALPSNAVGFAVLGYGRIGQRHARLIQENPEASLIAIADTIPKEAPSGIPVFSSLEALLACPEAKSIDVVTIATPNGLHVPQAMACLEAGKHVLVEKPVALHRSEMEGLLNLAAGKGLRVFPVLQNRWTPGAQWLKEMIEGGQLGKPILVQVNCFWNRDERYYQSGGWHGDQSLDGGVLYTQFSHFIDLVYWLFGSFEITDTQMIQARQWTDKTFPDTGSVHFRLASGGMGTFQFTTAVWDKNMESAISIIAENGSIKVKGQYLDQVAYCHVKGAHPSVCLQDWNPEEGHRRLLDNVIKVLKGKAAPLIDPTETAQVIGIIESIYVQTPS